MVLIMLIFFATLFNPYTKEKTNYKEFKLFPAKKNYTKSCSSALRNSKSPEKSNMNMILRFNWLLKITF